MAGSAGDFDPYHKWLGIPPRDQPPHHYRLLGLELFETDEEVIEAAASRLIAFCEHNAHGPHAADARRVVFEIAAARLCLLDPEKRAMYDQQLRSLLPAPERPSAGVTRNPAARPQAKIDRRVAPLPPRLAAPPPIEQAGVPPLPPAMARKPTPIPPAQRTEKPVAAAIAPTPAQVKDSNEDDSGFSIKIDTGGASRPARRTSGPKHSHASSSMELDEMLSGLTPSPPVEPTPPAGIPKVVVPQPPAIAKKPTPPPSPRAADNTELAHLFGDKEAAPQLVVPPVTATEAGGLDDLFGSIATSPAPAAGKRGRTSSKSRSSSAPETTGAEGKHDKKGKKKKSPQNLVIVGVMAALAVVLMVAGAFLLFGGGDSVAKDTHKKATKSDPADGEQKQPALDEKKSGEQPSVAKPQDASPAALPKPSDSDDEQPEEKNGEELPPGPSDNAATAATNTSQRLLEICARGGSDLEVKKLIADGANLEEVDLNRRTPLRLAVIGKYPLLIKALIAAKAEVNALDARGETPLMSAAQHGDIKIVATLIEAGADPNLATVGKGGKGSGTTPLHVAARQGNTEVAMLLVEHAARIDRPNQEGVTALMVAAWQGHEETALALLGKGADVKSTFDNEGQSPLMYAAHGGKIEIVKAMLSKGAVASHKSKSGTTALAIALASPEANPEVIERLRKVSDEEAPAIDF